MLSFHFLQASNQSVDFCVAELNLHKTVLIFFLFGISEFASQLPHDGGAFYTTDTTESSRPHYSASWPPILHAAALWLTAGGFKTNDSQKASNNAKNSSNNTNEGKCSVDSASDRFHLLFGICMEALCCQRSSESQESILTCLRALCTLLDSYWARKILVADASLPIELCNVLHR